MPGAERGGAVYRDAATSFTEPVHAWNYRPEMQFSVFEPEPGELRIVRDRDRPNGDDEPERVIDLGEDSDATSAAALGYPMHWRCCSGHRGKSSARCLGMCAAFALLCHLLPMRNILNLG